MNAAGTPLPLSNREKSILALSLTWAAGGVDVIGYMALSHAFVAHMTGNTVSAVLHATEGRWSEVFHRGVPIPTFFLGLLAAEVTLEHARRRGSRRVVCRALAIEAACLALFLAVGLPMLGAAPRPRATTAAQFVLLVGLIAAAMGVQSASLRKIGALTIFTTFMTGTLTKLAKDASDYAFWLRDRTRGRLRRRLLPALRLSMRQESFQSVVLLAALYLAYACGALCGAIGFARTGVAVIAAPLVLVLGAIVTDLVRPISPAP